MQQREVVSMSRRNWKTQMTTSETIVVLVLYLLVFPRLNAWFQQLLAGDGEPLVAEANVIYYALVLGLLLLFLWNFLKEDLSGFFRGLPQNLLGIGVGLVAAGGAYFLIKKLPFPVSDPISFQFAQEFLAAPVPVLVLILVLMPLVEEMVYRGLIYGHLREYNRPLAVVVCTLLYALALVWRYALEFSDPRYLLLVFLYLPVSCALTLCYERGGSIWGTALLHAGLNGAMLIFAL